MSVVVPPAIGDPSVIKGLLAPVATVVKIVSFICRSTCSSSISIPPLPQLTVAHRPKPCGNDQPQIGMNAGHTALIGTNLGRLPGADGIIEFDDRAGQYQTDPEIVARAQASMPI